MKLERPNLPPPALEERFWEWSIANDWCRFEMDTKDPESPNAPLHHVIYMGLLGLAETSECDPLLAISPASQWVDIHRGAESMSLMRADSRALAGIATMMTVAAYEIGHFTPASEEYTCYNAPREFWPLLAQKAAERIEEMPV